VEKVTVGCAEEFVFGDTGAALRKLLQRGDLLFEHQKKGFGIGGLSWAM
jgi:hypothetical protein